MANAIARKIKSLRTKNSMKNLEVAKILGMRPETLSRWISGRSHPTSTTKKTLRELEIIFDQLSDLYEPDEARQWIFERNMYLDGASPAEFIGKGKIDDVKRLVDQLRGKVRV
jgi:transcriptional regulator with XRE-family HTH domain